MPLLEDSSLKALTAALAELEAGFAGLPEFAQTSDATGMQAVLSEVAERLTDNYPYFHPLYAGQMLKPPHPVAKAAYALAMWLNPNNHALDGGRASSRMEVEAVAELAKMFGYEQHLGHLTGGGTMANLEALWVASRLAPGKTVVASAQAHYTHGRICGVLGIPFASVATESDGRMSMRTLRDLLQRGDVGTIVATLGTTATGAIDPLDEILVLAKEFGCRVHVDAAYGGYFTLAELAAQQRASFDGVLQADSIVIDPHKHGLQPYGCGCVLFRDPVVGRFYKHDSPYTYFSSSELHLGEISLECSRPGAAAVALWATQRLLPMVKDGEFAQGLNANLQAARELYARLAADARFVVPDVPPQLDIVVWAVRGEDVAASSASARRVMEAAAQRGLHLALAELPVEFFPAGTWPKAEATHVTCLRSVLMKPEHVEWLGAIWSLLDAAATE